MRNTWPDGDDQREPRVANRRVVDEKALRIIVTVEFLRQILQVERQLVRREFARRSGDLVGKVGEAAQQRVLVLADERRHVGVAQRVATPSSRVMPACRSTDATRACAYCT